MNSLRKTVEKISIRSEYFKTRYEFYQATSDQFFTLIPMYLNYQKTTFPIETVGLSKSTEV